MFHRKTESSGFYNPHLEQFLNKLCYITLTTFEHQQDNRNFIATLTTKNLYRCIFLCLTAVMEVCRVRSRKIKLYHSFWHSWPANYELLPTLSIKPHSRHICWERESVGDNISMSKSIFRWWSHFANILWIASFS